MKDISKQVLDNIVEILLGHLLNKEGEYFEYEIEEYFICGTLDLQFKWEDQSFSHEFGIEYCGDWKLQSVEDINIEYFGWVDNDGEDYELELTNKQLDYIIRNINKKL